MAKTNLDNDSEMSVEEARAYRAALASSKAPTKKESDRREDFRKFWAESKSKFGKDKDIEEVLWVHLKAINKDNSADFEAGISHFGLTKI